MSESGLDQIVKGAPPPGKTYTVPTTSAVHGAPDSPNAPPMHPSDPLAHLPSSPPQIYLNLLILEASLRTQYLELRARRRQHTFFLTLLGLWILYFGYALFFCAEGRWQWCWRIDILGCGGHREGLLYGWYRDGNTGVGDRTVGTGDSMATTMGGNHK